MVPARMRPMVLPLAVALSVSLAGCGGVFLAAGPSLGAGTMAVSGLQGGIGAHLEAGRFWPGPDNEWGAVGTGSLAGYSGEGDGDPIYLTTIEGRYRSWPGPAEAGPRPFFEAGAGPGMAWLAGPRQGGLTAHLAIGIGSRGSSLGWWLALRERPAVLFGGQAEFYNAVQLVLGLQLAGTR